jgi:hypothetical protein
VVAPAPRLRLPRHRPSRRTDAETRRGQARDLL